ncbi:hypothetical protein GCM10010841_18040 [Deinococcus aerophilus]|uniref:Lipoprotein n=1 Tax=Deinococcus aerophilus TaxID=522488 RepID=A0ABQ2GSX6_9DEIO|nr:hypothetical protein GCM10010841_18040 [Deinococcus aerophilus]
MWSGVLLAASLCACQPPPDPRVAELSARVSALEAEVRALKAAQHSGGPAGATDAGDVTARAAAQNCANALTRMLETFRQDSIDRRYPTPAQVELPGACAGQRVNWVTLEAQAYTFSLTDRAGKEQLRQRGP